MKTKFYRGNHCEYIVTENVIKCIAETVYKINADVYKLTTNGSAKCSPQDKFDYEFGCELAKTRAEKKFAKKIEKLLINYINTRTTVDKIKDGVYGNRVFYRYDLITPMPAKTTWATKYYVAGENMYKDKFATVKKTTNRMDWIFY